MPKVCINRPNRSKKRVYTERDVGRIIAYARNDGASDTLLFAYIAQSFGIRKAQCLLFRFLDVLNTTIFIGALIGMLSGIVYIIKGLRILASGKRGIVTTFLQAVVPKKYLLGLGAFFVWAGSVEAILSATIVFLTAISNNYALYLLMKGVCNAEVAPLNVPAHPVDIGDFPDRMAEINDILKETLTEISELE
jgi:hypothetical protein